MTRRVAGPVFFLGLAGLAAAMGCSSSEFRASSDDEDTSAGGAAAGSAGGSADGGGSSAGGTAGRAGGGASAGGGTAGGGSDGGGGGGSSAGAGGGSADAGATVDASLPCRSADHWCDGDRLLGCDESSGEYVVTDCKAGGKICQSGACVASCDPGTEGCGCMAERACAETLFCISDKCQRVDMPAPLAHWPFDGNLNDASGNGYHGVEYGTVTYDVSAAQTGAIFTQGHGRVPSFGETFRNTLDSFTLSVRLRVDAYPYQTELFGLSDSGSDVYLTNQWMLELCQDPSCDSDASPGVGIETELTDAGNNVYTRLGEPLPIGEWVHLVLVVEGTRITYYVDGVQVSSLLYTPAETGAATVYLGGTTSGSDSLNGAVDDIRVYDEIFTETQVQALTLSI